MGAAARDNQTVATMRPGDSFTTWHGYLHVDAAGTVFLDERAGPEVAGMLMRVECLRDGAGMVYDVTLEPGERPAPRPDFVPGARDRVVVRNLYQYAHTVHGSHGRRILLSGPGQDVGVA